MNPRYFIAVVALIISLCTSTATASQTDAIFSYKDILHPEIARNGMVASQEKLASQVGLDILKKGGNAVDAAVAVGFALSVTLPRAGNLGGGGFMLIHLAKENKVVALDYREKAPLNASRNMFLGPLGSVDSQKSRHSLLASGVPGTVYGLVTALTTYGSMSLEQVIAPAIRLAKEGIVVTEDLANSLKSSEKRLRRSDESARIFYPADGQFYEPGDTLIQSDLAQSLEQIATGGIEAFYKGAIANKIVTYMANNGGIITQEDLNRYTAVWRAPVQGQFRGYDIFAMPPPSSGGVHLIQILNLLDPYPLKRMGQNSAQSIHVLAEAMRLAYADRSKYLGDPDFVDVPVSGLISKPYANKLRPKIKLSRVSKSQGTTPGNPYAYKESNETTHYSVVDKWGNAVSNTYTLNFSYGNHHTVPGTGILLNNQMDDFSAKPGAPNAYGLIGGEFNAIAPEKRMLSSMTPTILTKDGRVFLVTGSPGGSRIISTVLQAVLNVVEHDMNIAEATAAPRVHHQWFPDVLRIEKGLSPDTVTILKQKGHNIQIKNAMGSLQSILVQDRVMHGASDPRKPGAATLGY